MKLVRIALLVLLAVLLLCTIACSKQEPVSGRLVIMGEACEETALFVSESQALVPLVTVLEGYGYSIEYVSDELTLVTKGEYIYHLNPKELTLYLMESPDYEDGEIIPHVDWLAYPVGGTAKGHTIRLDGDTVIVDDLTMLGILENMHERPRTDGSYEEGVIEFGTRAE